MKFLDRVFDQLFEHSRFAKGEWNHYDNHIKRKKPVCFQVPHGLGDCADCPDFIPCIRHVDRVEHLKEQEVLKNRGDESR